MLLNEDPHEADTLGLTKKDLKKDNGKLRETMGEIFVGRCKTIYLLYN